MKGRVLMVAIALLAALPAGAQQDQGFIPYGEEEQSPERGSSSKRRGPVSAKSASDAEITPDVWLARMDDPFLGLGVSAVAGVLLLDGARGNGVNPLGSAGVRLTWEFGRIGGNPDLADRLFGDVTWRYASLAEGTQQVFAQTHFHHLTVAPAYGFPLLSQGRLAAFVQAGGGVTYHLSSLQSGHSQLIQGGLKPTAQYGAGLRGAAQFGQQSPWRFEYRLEVTRFRRAYMDDTFIGIGLGALR